jgi:hypothetical protein
VLKLAVLEPGIKNLIGLKCSELETLTCEPLITIDPGRISVKIETFYLLIFRERNFGESPWVSMAFTFLGLFNNSCCAISMS